MTARITRTLMVAVLGALIGASSACLDTPAEPVDPETSFLAVTPQGGATAINPAAPIVIQFSGAVQPEMSMYAVLHDGDATGPTIACTARWSSDSTILTLMPLNPLMSMRMYTLHVGGGMRDANGNVIDMTQHGVRMGGQWATGTMMGSHGGMSQGWQGGNGMYGMLFSFTTS